MGPVDDSHRPTGDLSVDIERDPKRCTFLGLLVLADILTPFFSNFGDNESNHDAAQMERAADGKPWQGLADGASLH